MSSNALIFKGNPVKNPFAFSAETAYNTDEKITPGGLNMRVLVTGAAGQLGHDVLALLRTRGIECRGADLAEFDLTDGAAAKAFVTAYAPTVIVHCAAYTNVDKAESEPEICAEVNGMGTMNMVRAALAVNAKLLYISTDYVFDGSGERPWEPDDEYGPLNVQGSGGGRGPQPDDPLLYPPHQLGVRPERKKLCPHHAPAGGGKA